MSVRAHQVMWWTRYSSVENICNSINEFLASFYENGYKFVDVRFQENMDADGDVWHSAQVIYTAEVENA